MTQIPHPPQPPEGPLPPEAAPSPDAPQAQVVSPIPLAPDGPQATEIHCVKCGYNLTGVTIGSTCPECGAPVNNSYFQNSLPPAGLATAALVMGIISIPSCLFYGIPALICGILAIIFSRVSVRQMRRGLRSNQNAGLARAGLVCGIIGTILGVIGIGVLVAIIAFAVHNSISRVPRPLPTGPGSYYSPPPSPPAPPVPGPTGTPPAP